jgi:hypothetical protein
MHRGRITERGTYSEMINNSNSMINDLLVGLKDKKPSEDETDTVSIYMDTELN